MENDDYEREIKRLRDQNKRLRTCLKDSVAAMNAAHIALNQACAHLPIDEAAEAMSWINGDSGGIDMQIVTSDAVEALLETKP